MEDTCDACLVSDLPKWLNRIASYCHGSKNLGGCFNKGPLADLFNELMFVTEASMLVSSPWWMAFE
jgi:hypothetical protein